MDHGIGILPTNRTPTGAFSYVLSTAARAYVFGLWDHPSDLPFPNTNVGLPTTILASKQDPKQSGSLHLEFEFSKHKFWQVAPVVVRNADHDLPEISGDGLVLFGDGEGNAVYLAWMRLDPDFGPLLDSVRYYVGGPARWTDAGMQHEPEATPLFALNPVYTFVSAAWLMGPQQWIVLYSNAFLDPASNRMDPARPAVARFGVNPWTWSDEVQIFNPCRDLAYGRFMHWSGLDDINRRIPPTAGDDLPGWPYGFFYLQRFTTWDAGSRELALAYLMSTSRPYQVQVMRTTLRLPSAHLPVQR